MCIRCFHNFPVGADNGERLTPFAINTGALVAETVGFCTIVFTKGIAVDYEQLCAT